MIDPNTFGWSDIARRREFEKRHQGAKIQPMDRLETALSRHWITSFGWILLLGIGVAAPIVGFAILRGGM